MTLIRTFSDFIVVPVIYNGFYLLTGERSLEEFSMLGEVRSLIPGRVNIMALTATATKLTRQKVVRILGMRSPVVVSISPQTQHRLLDWRKEKRGGYVCCRN